MKWTRTQRLSALATAFVAAFAFSGCMKTDDKTTLEKDGSGTADITVAFDMSKMKELKDMFGSMMPQAPTTPPPAMEGDPAPAPTTGDDPLAEFSEEKVKKELASQPGNELKKYTRETKDGKDTVYMKIAFTSYENLCKAGVGGNKAVTVAKAEDGSYSITLDGMGGQDAGGESAAGAEMMLPMLEPFMAGMEMKMELTLPGTIIETNGTKSEDGTKVSWAMTWKDIVAAMKEKKKDGTSMKVTFKGEGIEIKPFSFKPDAEKAAGKMGFGPK